MNELLIGTTGGELKDAWIEYGIRMGDGFLDTLSAPIERKELISNESRLIDGRVITDYDFKFNYRDVSLSFRIIGENQDDFKIKRNKFYELLAGVKVTMNIPKEDPDVYYHFHVKAKGATHNYDLSRTMASITVKFEESNPAERGETLPTELRWQQQN